MADYQFIASFNLCFLSGPTKILAPQRIVILKTTEDCFKNRSLTTIDAVLRNAAR